MQTTEVEKLRDALQAALDALPPKAESEKPKPAWLGALSDSDHNAACGSLQQCRSNVHCSSAVLAARWCLHALNASGAEEARHCLKDAARNVAEALAELEG